MTNVLFILDTLRQRFGVTSVAMNYFRNINDNVHIDFLCLPDSEDVIVNEILDSGSKVYYMPRLTLSNFVKFRKFFIDFFSMHHEYSIVHSHFNQIDSIVFPIAKKYGQCICVSHSHSTAFSTNRIKAIRNRLMCVSINKHADVWAACSVKAGNFLYGKGFEDSPKALVVYNGIDVMKFKFNKEVRDSVRKELGLKNEIVIGHVGSFNIIKNHTFIIEMFSKLIKRNDYKLVLVGGGELQSEIRQKVDYLGLSDKVIFTGVRKDVNRLFQAMDIFILPSHNEGLPVVGIEAQTSGLPCLFSDTITREVGICNSQFLSIENSSIWVDKIEELVGFRRLDCSKIIEENGYTMTKCADKLSNFYTSIVRCK